MNKYLKCFIGVIICVVSGLAGTVIWALQSDTVRMKSDSKTAVMAIVAAAFIPSVIVYVVWYLHNRKALDMPGMKKWGFAPFFCIGLVITAAIVLIPAVFVFSPAIKFMVISLAIAVVGNLIAYLALKV